MFSTERLILRKWQIKDLKHFVAMNENPQVMEFMPKILTAYESLEFAERIIEHFQNYGFGLFVCELRKSGEFIGYTGLNFTNFQASFTPAFEIGWRLDSKYWNQGYASEAARSIVHNGFNRFGLNKIVSFTAVGNQRSRRVMEKIGMIYDYNFSHPKLPKDHPLSEHVLYSIDRKTHEING
jgi:RimJ/RimL family protein N-acetyltransferase